jgi:hypothetical protein
MGIVPSERTEHGPPFTNVGMDCFGPFLVKERCSELERWGVLYTCLYTRAINFEVIDDMTADSFVNSVRCSQAKRGSVQTFL